MLFRSLLALAGLVTISSQDAVGSRGCTASTCVFSNSFLRFGSGTETSVNTWGLFQQPWYYSGTANTWYQLTYSNYPLDTAVGTGNGTAHWSGTTIVNLYSLTPSYSTNDYSGFIVSSSDTTKTVGYGTIVATRSFSVSGQNVLFRNTFSLGQNDSFVKITNVMINNSTAPVQNAYIWVGTRDDFVGTADVNTKTRGNLIAGNFTAITANNQSSHAIMITNTNEGVLFYSETAGVMTSYAACCSFSNAYTVNPLTLAPMTPTPTDGSYAAVLPLGTIGVNASASIVWYYAAGAVSSLGAVAQTVAAAQVADAGPAVIPTTTSVPIATVFSTFSMFPVATRITTFTAYPVPTATTLTTATAVATGSAVATESVTASATPTPSTTATLHVYLIAATPQNIYISGPVVQYLPDNTPFIYLTIPLSLGALSCCIFCCFGACYYRKKYLDSKKESETQTEPQTVSVDADTIHVRTVEEGEAKNPVKKPPFLTQVRV